MIEKASIPFRLTLPSRAGSTARLESMAVLFTRRANWFHAINGTAAGTNGFRARPDRAYVESLMNPGFTNPEKSLTGWPAGKGINGQPFDFCLCPVRRSGLAGKFLRRRQVPVPRSVQVQAARKPTHTPARDRNPPVNPDTP